MSESRWEQCRKGNKLKYTKMETESESVTREYDDEQYKLNEEQENDDDTEIMVRAEEIAQQYETIKDRTVDDNTVLGKVKEINTSEANNNLYVDIDLPAKDKSKTFRFKKPKVWSERYEFIRWIRHYDYDADSFPGMLEDNCHVKVFREDDSSDYELFVPDMPKGLETDGDFIDRKIEGIRNIVSGLHNAYKNSKQEQTYAVTYLSFLWVIIGIALLTQILTINSLTALETFGVYLIGILIILGINVTEEWYKNTD